MNNSFTTSKPIYQQIMEEIKGMIARNEWHRGSKLPSQKELAVKMGVNHNTIQRVYRELEAEGFVETLRGQGTFVCDNENVVAAVKQDMVEKALQEFLNKMQSLGLSSSEILDVISEYMEGGGRETDGESFNC